MYAITDASFRSVASGADAREGETVVDQLPAALLKTLAGVELRTERNALLRASDWTQADDAPLSTAQKAEWGLYRAALRALPEHPDWPECAWPVPPALQGAAAA